MGDVEHFIVLLVTATLATVVSRWIHLSYTLALLILGLALGAFDLVPSPGLSSDVILLLFLPPLLFEAAFVLDPRRLWSVRIGVSVLAILGVLLATAIGGAIVYWGLGLPWTISLLFGAIIASTDPVAVLATIRELGVNKRFATLLEGESLLNDGIALVLLVVLIETVETNFDPIWSIGIFLLSLVGGTAVGIATGWIGHLLIARVDEHFTEMIVSVAMAYGSFLAAVHFELSGVLATVATAMTLGHLGRTRGWIYSQGAQRLLIDLWEFLAFVANAGLFLLMGLAVRTSDMVDHPEDVLFGVAAALVGRAAVAYGLGELLTRSGFALSHSERHVLFWGGLRGAVALAAALSLAPDFPHRDDLLAMTYGAVLFTLIAQGLTIGPLVHCLGLKITQSSTSKTDDRAIPVS